VFGKKKGFFFFFARKIAGVWPEGEPEAKDGGFWCRPRMVVAASSNQLFWPCIGPEIGAL